MRTGRLGEVNSCFVNYLSQRTYHSARPDWSPGISSSVFLSRRLDSSRDLYHKDLYAHYGCVNAIEFSASGDLLVSGGDDRRVLLWNIDGVLSENRPPQAMKGEHNSNIFCLSFDSCNSKIFSAGNDEQVIVHDLKTGDLVDVFLHREAVYGVSVNPTLDSVFASAGEDGQILMYDMRESPASDPVCLARYHDAFHSVQFHPSEPTFIVTANSREGVSLWDVRKPKVPVLRYGEKQCAQSSMCAKFNRMGTQIVALRRRLPPILYDTQYSKPVSEFDAEHYYNSCTMKSCCFAGDRDQFILSGSDDFNLYMWKIPQSKRGGYFVSEEEEEEAHMVLKGHRSIVNQVRFNPHNLIIASSGVEKIVKLWSGVSLPGSKGSLQTKSCRNFMSRRVYTYEEYIGLVMESGQVFADVNHDYSHGSTDEDPRMMAFFDSLVQRELEGWTSNTDLSSHDDQEEEEDDNDVETTQQMLSPDEEEEEDNDTEEATQSSSSSSSSSSAVTSQSEDDNDSAHIHGPSGAQRHGTSSRSTTYAAEGGRGAQSWAARSSSRRCRGLPNETRKDDDDDDDDDEDDEANKVSGASEWIMCMIAKKRAQLRAASARRKNLSSRRQHKKTRRHQHKFLRCSYTKTNTSSRRRYLYHPAEESQRNGNQDVQPQPQQQEQEQQANGESPLSLPSAMSSTVAMRRRRRRRHSFRRYMAPYTIMVVDSDLQSSEEEEDEEEPHQQQEEEEANANQDHNHSSDGRAGQASLPRPQSAADAETNGAVNKRKRRPQQLWSAPDGSHSSGNDNGRRRRRISGERSSHVGGGSSRRSDEGDLENGRGPWCSSSQENGAKNGHVFSWEIVDCNNASEEEGEESEVEIRSRSNGVTRTTTLNVMNSLPGGSEGTGGNRNNLVSNLGSVGVSDSSVVAASALAASSHLEEDSLSQQQGIIPISSVSIDDDSGSLLFDTPSSVAAAAMIQNNHVEEEENEDFVTSSSSSRGSWKNDDRVVVVQNGGGVSGGDTCPSEGGSIWRENGAKTKISSLEEEKETNNGVSEETTNNPAASAAVGVNNNGRENDNSSKVVSFAFKKRRGGGHHSNSVRNYRKKHQEEEEEEEEDF
ncbi:DDB1- and CUL4-associated factor 5 isoform X2 [Palaemon carinicauda]|uniref:DDB1- and CUL4-associated factor 5 isoform X2 n=1 Tax=Palaemon carinicauda TaxID=392227 RepID=UPI0035B5E6D2